MTNLEKIRHEILTQQQNKDFGVITKVIMHNVIGLHIK